ncbi:MAG: p-aminobenzoyl-glutamate transport protein [bacterium]|nr:p-aminobenzoyl-glutamate transport protein [bacterium]
MKMKIRFSGRIFYRMLDFVEKIGNLLPHPTSLFALFALSVIIFSGIMAAFEFSAIHPGTGETIKAVSLLNGDGLRRIMTDMVKNFTGFAPLGTVLVALLGIGVAEGTGLIGAAIRLLVLKAPPSLLTAVLVFAGIMSNAGSEIGYVLLVPLGAVIFLAVGRHPLAGLAAAFAGVSGGYSANLLLGTVDPLLAGLSQEAARIIDPNYLVNPACNYYFMFVSTFVLTAAGTWVSEKIVEPRLGKYEGTEKAMELQALSPAEKRGLKFALVATLIIVGLILWAVVPANGVLRDPKTGDLLHSPFLSGIVALLFLSSAIAGIAYGIGAGTVRQSADIVNPMGKAMSTLGSYIALVFFAAQFVAYFGWTNLGLITAVKGAEFLKSIGFEGIPLMVSFVLVTTSLNMFMGSASAKWAVMAPVFVPMFMLLGYTPELTQAVYRVGDSCTNIISPMMSYFALIVSFVQRYSKDAGIGTVIATMLPFTVTFLVVWSVLLVIWLLLGLPMGPGAGLYLGE